MNRNILKYLESWQSKGTRRPLLLRGARQVGKTWAVRQHGKSYLHFIECNLDERPEYARVIRDLYGNPDKLIQALQDLTGVPAIPGKTLLFLDEIQDTPEALKSLRYFKEKLPELHVIATGSLLEFAIKEQSFPVGRVEFAHMFPLDFAEFLEAKGREDLVAQIQAMRITSRLARSPSNL
jgi:predicted AAA+ superfamily ATPase